MLKKVSLFALVFLFVFTLAVPIQAEAAQNVLGQEQLVLLQKSNKMYQNGTLYTATQPVTELKGTTYVSARSIAERLGGKVVFDKVAKEYVLTTEKNVLRYAIGSSSYNVNGTVQKFTGAPYNLKGTLMIPLRTLLQPQGIAMKVNKAEKKITLTWTVKIAPVATFTVSPKVIYANETQVTYTNQTTSSTPIIDERWDGNLAMFEQPGTYTVTHWVQDSDGVWSEPYAVTLEVLQPNLPPVAKFVTNKTSYMMGEPIEYTDLSSDEENAITSTSWTNKQQGFFEPGPQTITLKVTDKHGASNEFSLSIMIEDQELYSKQDFGMLFTPPGERFSINGASVLNYDVIPYSLTEYGQQTLLRSNSPERIVNEGVYYTDSASGNVRLMSHNVNNRLNNVRMYIVATNETNQEATVQTQRVGIGGPALYVSATGKSSISKYLTSRMNPVMNDITTIPAGESRLILKQLSDLKISPDRVLTMMADVSTSGPIKFSYVIIDDGKDVLSELPLLPYLEPDGIHIRGTFEKADRTINLTQPIGSEPGRMIFGDKVVDTRLTTIDKLTGATIYNEGNYGVVYVVKLFNVQPNTLIALNPRGGHYGGAFLVNNNVVLTTNNSFLANNGEAGVLYRTGSTSEAVTIVFSPASGSNLPINLLFMPMPEKKG
ncbi:stalk domain-containing protein [Paenibacillus sp. KS-LC4]|uniref:copper amine oxidase N-terminal domain-containing protein n=1 Tax=Paenibacillus sp. KS-LC4 TaxID=2979727 RepID=UPI0030CC714A